MRPSAFSFLLLGLFIIEPSQAIGPSDSDETCLTLTVEGLIPQTGILRAALFQSSDGFPGNTKKAFSINRTTVTATSESLIFGNIPFGSYALSVYQDLNNDHRLNQSWLGIPQEPVGFSNDPPMRKGPPHFEDAVFDFHDPQKKIIIHMRKR